MMAWGCSIDFALDWLGTTCTCSSWARSIVADYLSNLGVLFNWDILALSDNCEGLWSRSRVYRVAVAACFFHEIVHRTCTTKILPFERPFGEISEAKRLLEPLHIFAECCTIPLLVELSRNCCPWLPGQGSLVQAQCWQQQIQRDLRRTSLSTIFNKAKSISYLGTGWIHLQTTGSNRNP